MNTFLSLTAQPSKLLRLLGWGLGFLFVFKSLDFFLAINLTATSELSPVILEAILFSISGIAMLLLAIGTIRLARWVRVPLYLVFVSNALFIIYSTLLVPNWIDASISVVGAVVLFFYLKKSKGVSTGRRLLGLQVLTIVTLLPATIFIGLSVVFPDQALQDDSVLRLGMAETISDTDNLYITLTNFGDGLPRAAKAADELVSEYPANWNQSTANQLLLELQPNINAYTTATEQEYQCPTSVNNFAVDAEMCELNLLRDYAQMMQFAALTEVQRGNAVLAQEYATAPIEVGRTILQSDNITLIEYLVGLASINIGLDTLEMLEKEDVLSQSSISTLLEDVSIPITTLRTPLQREYLELRIAIDESLDLPQTYLYHPNRTRNELFTFMNKAIDISATTCDVSTDTSSQKDTELLEYIESVQRNASNPTRPNMIGNMYLSVVLASMSGVGKNVCDTNERIQNIQID